MRGRKPKPTERQISEGDPRKHGKRKLDERLKAEPKATSGLPSCPKHLKGRARSAWTFWSEELRAMKLSKRPDGPMLEGTCRAYERAVMADLILDKDGLIVQDLHVTEEGDTVVIRTKKHPAVEISNRSWLIVRAFCSEFGLSPVSRTRLKIEEGDDAEDELKKLLALPRNKTSEHPTVQ